MLYRELGDRGILTTMKWLLFAVTLMTVFGVFVALYGNVSVSSATLAVQATAVPGGNSGTLTAVWGDNTPVKVRLGLNGVAFDFWAVHYSTQNDYVFTLYATTYGDNGLEPQTVWFDVAIAQSQSRVYPTQMIPWDWMQNAVIAWPADKDVNININMLTLKEGSATYGTASISLSAGEANFWSRTWVAFSSNLPLVVGGTLIVAGAVFGSWIGAIAGVALLGTSAVSSAFGGSPAAFIDMLGKLLTFDFPGVPIEMRLLIGTPLVFMTLYTVLIIVRSFIPTLGTSTG
jgi:hypothetical protein